MRACADLCLYAKLERGIFMYFAASAAAALFALLGGIFLMRRGLSALFGEPCKQRLRNLRLTPWRGLAVGALAASLMQSSTAVSLLAIAFVDARSMTFKQSLGIILGANIGTCTTVQFFTLQPPEALFYLLAPFLLGALILPKLRRFALPAVGFFLIFAALSAFSVLSRSAFGPEEFRALLAAFHAPILAPLCLGIAATALLQSSSAATLLLMAVAAHGEIGLQAACYIVYGNNIGSCLSSLIVACGATAAAKRTALAHLFLNLLGALAFLPLTDVFTTLLTALSSDFAKQVALAHTIFNLISSLAVMPWVTLYARLITSLVPNEKKAPFPCHIHAAKKQRPSTNETKRPTQ